MTIVCVLDLDETLGTFYQNMFYVRPKVTLLINLLRLLQADIILWSYGEDDYVRRVINGHLPIISNYAYKIFGRSESHRAEKLYRYAKASEHIRNMYESTIFLMAVDDQVSKNMDSKYDIRIQVPPYRKPNPNDRILVAICEKIIESAAVTLDHSSIPSNKESSVESEDHGPKSEYCSLGLMSLFEENY